MSRPGLAHVPVRRSAVAVCLILAATPALSGPFGWGPGLGFQGSGAAGLFGGLALGLMAGAARRPPVIVEEIAPEPDETIVIERAPAPGWRPAPRGPGRIAREPSVPQSRPEAPDHARRSAAGHPAALAACRDALARAAKGYGGRLVSVAPSQAPAGATSVTVKARVRYGGGARGETRDAQVTCRLNGAGEVVALR